MVNCDKPTLLGFIHDFLWYWQDLCRVSCSGLLLGMAMLLPKSLAALFETVWSPLWNVMDRWKGGDGLSVGAGDKASKLHFNRIVSSLWPSSSGNFTVFQHRLHFFGGRVCMEVVRGGHWQKPWPRGAPPKWGERIIMEMRNGWTGIWLGTLVLRLRQNSYVWWLPATTTVKSFVLSSVFCIFTIHRSVGPVHSNQFETSGSSVCCIQTGSSRQLLQDFSRPPQHVEVQLTKAAVN